MGIPSYRAEGHGHNRRITVTFYGKVPPDHFSVMGVEYESMTKCRMVARVREDGRTMLECSRCGHVCRRSLAPSVGEHCRCGARVVAYMDGKLRAYCVDHGSGVCYDQVPKDPAKAYRCTVTVATAGEHECRVNRVTGDVFDRVGDERHYVGKSYGSDERDIGLWRRYLVGIHALSPHGRHGHAR